MFRVSIKILILTAVGFSSSLLAAEKPNIVFILADDMGIGDVFHCGGKAPTPFLDQLAKEGMRFTDAHSSSSVCTPTRYSCLTGRYNWRTRLKRSVFFNPHDRPLIEPGETTIASMLKSHGYTTGCVGKWHLGIGWQFLDDFTLPKSKKGQHGWDIDYSKSAVTPTSHGFDYFFGIQASLDMAPYVYIENDKATQPGTVVKAFHRKGAAAEDFEAVHCLRDFARQSIKFIEASVQADKPFFLYLPLTSPHTPIVPSEKWQGKSGIGAYGDFLMETDWVVGEVMNTLERLNQTKNTLVIFTTDNGCSPAAKIKKLEEQGHVPNGGLRGHKADIYEGGHRVPFIVKWPGQVQAGTVTKRLTCQTDIIRTLGEIVAHEFDEAAAVDSVSFLNTLKGDLASNRSAVVHHSIDGAFAIRDGKWKLCVCKGSGGWSAPRPGKAPKDAPVMQLFDLDADLEESENLYDEHPEVVARLMATLRTFVDQGRSTPGQPCENVGEISLEPRM